MGAHGHDLGDDGLASPLDTEYLGKLLQVVSGSLTNGEDGIAEPSHAEVAELLVEELNAELAGEEGNVLDDSEAHTPLLVLGQLDNGWEKGLGEQVDANNCQW